MRVTLLGTGGSAGVPTLGGADGTGEKYIATAPKRGYRFTATVRVAEWPAPELAPMPPVLPARPVVVPAPDVRLASLSPSHRG